ncbi:hypothetical protein GCM10027271_32260 [Saccharopolyspora gloriosae]
MLFTLVHTFTAEADPVHREPDARCGGPDDRRDRLGRIRRSRLPRMAAPGEPIDVEHPAVVLASGAHIAPGRTSAPQANTGPRATTPAE